MVSGNQGQLGSAYAELRIDLRQFISDGEAAVQAARNIQQQLEQTGSAASETAERMSIMGTDAGAAFSMIAAGGLAAAMEVRNLNIQFEVLTGNQTLAAEQMETLRNFAEGIHQPFLQAQEMAMRLVPALRAGNAELDTAVNIAMRLGILIPENARRAAFSLREFIAGQYISLARSFNIERAVLIQIRDQARGDQQLMLELLGEYLDSIGITNAALRQMGEEGVYAMENMADAGRQLAYGVFDPFLDTILIPMIQGVTDLMHSFRDFFAMLGQEAPVLNQVVGLLATIMGISGGANAISRLVPGMAGIAGSISQFATALLAVAGGLEVGAEAVRELSRRGVADESYQYMDTGQQLTAHLMTFTSLLSRAATVVWNTVGILAQALKVVAVTILEGGSLLVEAFGRIIQWLGETIPGMDSLAGAGAGIAASAGQTAQMFADQREEAVQEMRRLWDEMQDIFAGGATELEVALHEVELSIFQGNDALLRYKGRLSEAADATEHMANILRIFAEQTTEATSSFTNEQIDAWIDFQADLASIAQEYQAEIVAAEEDFQQRRLDLEREYTQNLARLREDWAIDDERSRRDYEESRREYMADYQRNTEDDEEEHLRRLQQIRRDGRQSMLEAAARLDAWGVWQAWQNQRERERQENERYEREREERQEQYEIRLEEMRQQFEREQQETAQDRALRLRRMREDHEQQLAELKRDHAQRLVEINSQYARERAARQNAFIQEMDELGMHFEHLSAIRREQYAIAEAELYDWWKGINRMFGLDPTGNGGGGSGPLLPKGGGVAGGGLGGKSAGPPPALAGGNSFGDVNIMLPARGVRDDAAVAELVDRRFKMILEGRI
jgi:hypothetical protein